MQKQVIKFECLIGLGKNRNRKKGGKKWKQFIKKEKIKKKETHKNYTEYLQTKWWRNRKVKYWEDNKRTCFCCEEKARELHHNTYTTLYREEDKDLIPLCRKCHEEVHTLILNDEQITLVNSHIVHRKLLQVIK